MIRRMAGGVVLIAVALWLGGYVWYVQRASAPPRALPHADGIVVLTGGSNRIERGMRLLAAGQAPLLLVSGVLPGTQAAHLALASGVDPAMVAGRVALGFRAISTRGNAEETAGWVRRHHLRSVIVVTAFYHMPRAMAELRRSLPETRLYACPVVPTPLPGGAPLTRLWLLAKEYSKFLFVRLDLPVPTADLRPAGHEQTAPRQTGAQR
jgi:uncharacterized SAM-binding protein YcdF (DUF218 family)